MKRLLSLLLLLSAMQSVAAVPAAADVPAACGFAAASDFPAVPASVSAFARRDASASGFQADPAPGFHALFGFHGSPVIYAAFTSGSAAGFSSGSATDSVFGSSSGSAASAAAAGATQGAGPLPPAADRAAGILAVDNEAQTGPGHAQAAGYSRDAATGYGVFKKGGSSTIHEVPLMR